MTRRRLLPLLVVVLLPLAGVPLAAQASARGERLAVDEAARLARIAPDVRVVLIDPELAPDVDAVRRLDAFVVRERSGALRRAIYVNREAACVRAAATGSRFMAFVLAAILRHEAAHLEGASEADARRAELAFFHELVATGVVPGDDGRRYLRVLATEVRSHGAGARRP